MRLALTVVLGGVLGACAAQSEPGDPAAETCVDPAGDAPWLSLAHYGNEVEDGSSLRVECGPQGVFMISVLPEVGGFSPTAEWMELEVTLEVEGFSSGPDGTFFRDAAWPLYLGCDAGPEAPPFIPMLVPDAVENVEALNGQPGRLRVTGELGAMEIDVEYDVVISAENVGDYFFCYGQ